MIQTVVGLKNKGVIYKVEAETAETITKAKVTWTEYDRFTGVPVERTEEEREDHLKETKARLEEQLSAVTELVASIDAAKAKI